MAEERNSKGGKRRGCLRLIAGLVLLLVLLLAASIVVNLTLPESSSTVEKLSAEQEALLAEAFHLRQTLGDDLWPGWAAAQIPIVIYNESYAFLVGYPGDPPPGWTKVPQGQERGGPWQTVPGDDFLGQPYYRQPLPDGSSTPEAFTVRIGQQWAASMQTREWMRIAFNQQLQRDLPSFLKPVFPYPIVTSLFLGGDDKYVSLLLHETFHAFEGLQSPQRLAEAEEAQMRYGGGYPSQARAMEEAWQEELNLLADALEANDETESLDLARAFLGTREERRAGNNLPPALVDYERQREWLEGQAKYVEMMAWRLGGTASSYEPHKATAALDDFDAYEGYEGAWNREVDQIRRMAGDDGEARFYYSGMAQAALLDRLLPGWKVRALEEGVFLEDLLQEAVE